MKVSDALTRAFYAVAGRDAEYILENTMCIRDVRAGARARIKFDWRTSQPLIYLPPDTRPIPIFHELAHAYHVHHWPVVSHFCAVGRCEEAASCLTWMAAYMGVLDYSDVREHDEALVARQRANMLVGMYQASRWVNYGDQQPQVNAVIRGILHADLR